MKRSASSGFSREKMPLYLGEDGSLVFASLGSVDVVTIKIPHGVDILLYQPVLHPIFTYWVG